MFFILLSIYFSKPLPNFWGLCDRISVFHSLFLSLWKDRWSQRSDTALHEVRGKLKPQILWGPLGRGINQSTTAWAHLGSPALWAAFTWNRSNFVKACLRPEVLPFLTRGLNTLHWLFYVWSTSVILRKGCMELSSPPENSSALSIISLLLCSSTEQTPVPFHPALHPGTCL